MILDFNKMASKGNEFMVELAFEFGYGDDRDRVARVLESILFALRNHLTIEESVQLLAQLPRFLKAVYVEKWSLRKKYKRVRHFKEFYEEIRSFHPQTAAVDFPTDDAIDNALNVLFIVLRRYISLGELEDMKAVLPKELKVILNSPTMI